MQHVNDAEMTVQLIRVILEMSAEDRIKLMGQLNGSQRKKKRAKERKSYYVTVDYAIEGQFFRDFIKDISSTGAFIKTSNAFPVGQNISLTFMAPDNQKSFKVNGEIVRSFPNGIGVHFAEPSKTHEETIRSIMEMVKEI